jgi:hypothetical protein
VRNYDLEFLKRFSMVLAFLALVTLGLILFAHHLNSKVVHEVDPATHQRLLARIAPTGDVYAGATGAAAQPPPPPPHRRRCWPTSRCLRWPHRRCGDLQ